MPDYHVTFEWSQKSSTDAGHTMSFWNQAGDVATAKAQASKLRERLDDITGAQVICNHVRIAQTPGFRKVANQNFPTAAARTVDETTNADYPTTAILLRVENALDLFTRQWVRGIPDSIIFNSGQLNAEDATWKPKFAKFVNELKSGSNSWRIRVSDTSKPDKLIDSIDHSTGTITITGHGYTVGVKMKVRIKGVRSHKSFNGVKRVLVSGANTLSLIPYKVPAVVEDVEFNSAYLREQAYSFLAITDVIPERSTSHQTGSPTKRRSGRRRTRR